MRAILLIIFVLISYFSIGQNAVMTVHVTDSVTGSPLPFANIYLTQSHLGASTNYDGIAQLPHQHGINDSIVISYIGYQTKTIATPSSGNILVRMSNSFTILNEVVIQYEKPIPAIQIVKKAIKATPENYAPNDVIMKCFYRETIEEEGRFIQLNEAETEVYYTRYPQETLDKSYWVKWHFDEEYLFDLESDGQFMELLKDFNTKQDQMRLLEVRSSNDGSRYDFESSLMGGPLSLTAYDKLKYQYDFLDPKLLSKYHYESEGLVTVNNETCYQIRFRPARSKGGFSYDQSRKTKDAIYTGTLFISSTSYAVVKFEYNLAVERNYGFFKDQMPLDYRISLSYIKQGNLWYLDHIKASELKVMGVRPTAEGRKDIVHKGTRELFVTAVEIDSVQAFEDSTVFKATKFSSVRYRAKEYNATFWDSANYWVTYPLAKRAMADLEAEALLATQFPQQFQVQETLATPIAARKPYHFNYHSDSIPDSLHWMALPSYTDEFIQYLNEENKYAKNFLLKDRKYQRKLFDEIDQFYPKEKSEVSDRLPHSKTFYVVDSTNQFIFYAALDTVNRVELFNVTVFEDSHPDLQVVSILPNSDNSLLSVQSAFVKRPGATVYIVPAGQQIAIDSITSTSSTLWFSDTSLLFVRRRVGEVDSLFWRNILTRKDSFLLAETDETFSIRLSEGSEILCSAESASENEIYFVDDNSGIPTLKLVAGRAAGVQYTIKGHEGKWYMLTNESAPNSKLLHSRTSFPFQWEEVVKHSRHIYIESFNFTQDFLVLNIFDQSIPKVCYRRNGEKRWQTIPIEGPLQFSRVSTNTSIENQVLVTSSGPSCPKSTHRFNLVSEDFVLVNRRSVKDSIWLSSITVERHWAKSHDNVKVPMTVIKSKVPTRYHQGCILHVYGAYGAMSTPLFSSDDAVLLRQGYTIVYAHVRGGSILGGDWYEEGKLLKKHNSVEDYVACARYLIEQNITTPDFLVAFGSSAAGIVVGAAINEHPELFNTAVLDHPYLDVTNTMMHDSLPLTTGEYKEWGNPNDTLVYAYISSYSPYQNINKQAYPNLIFLAGYWDYQTPAWQVAKHVAALRDQNTGDNETLFLTDLNSGHGGNRGGKEWIKSIAHVYSFVHLMLFDPEH
jgi:protease II